MPKKAKKLKKSKTDQKIFGSDEFNGHSVAAEIDDILNRVLRNHPPNKKNYRGWLTIHRTIGTSLEIIDEVFLNPLGRKLAKE